MSDPNTVSDVTVLSNDVLFGEDEPSQTGDNASIYSTPSTYSNSSQDGTIKFSRNDANYASLTRRGRRAIYQKHSEDSAADYGFIDYSNTENIPPRTNQSLILPNRDKYATVHNAPKHGPPPLPPPRPKGRSSSYTDDTYARRGRLKGTQSIFEDNYTLPNKPQFNRRNTWSPPPINRDLSVPYYSNNCYGTSRNSTSNSDSQAAPGYRVYETPDIKEPANLPPESGVLNQSPDKVVLRPLAFKPVMPSKPSPPLKTRHDPSHSLSDEGYSDNVHTSPGNLSSGYGQISPKYSGRLQKNSDHALYGAINKHCDRPGSQSSSTRVSANHLEGYVMTPSPDSGVAVSELEALLRDKESQINHLRETMDQNERVIFQVLEEKQIAWELEMDELKRDCQDRIKSVQHKATKAEQSFLLKIYKLQQEKKKLQEDLDDVSKNKEKSENQCKGVEAELSSCQSELEKVKWDLHQKSGEISLLKTQIKEVKDELAAKTSDNLVHKTQVKDLRDIINGKNVDIADMDKEIIDIKAKLKVANDKIESLNSNKNVKNICDYKDVKSDEKSSQTLLSVDDNNEIGEQNEVLEANVLRMHSQLLQQREDFDVEREKWLEEKNKVICYQKQLQLNYVQMYRKNKMLEADIEQLTLDLERRDMQLLEHPPGEETESAC